MIWICLAFAPVAATAVAYFRWSIRQYEAKLAWLELRQVERRDRVYEDVCWDALRQDAYDRAMRITIARGDEHLLRDLGIALDPAVTRRRLEAVT
jgi:hypothetical protein